MKVRDRFEEEALDAWSAQILDELNVKELVFGKEREASSSTSRSRPNAALLGPKYGGALRDIEEALRGLDAAAVRGGRAREPGRRRGVDAGAGGAAGQRASTRKGIARRWNGLFGDGADGDRRGAAGRRPGAGDRAPLADDAPRRRLRHRRPHRDLLPGRPGHPRVITGFGDYIRQETLSVDLRAEEPPPDAHREEHDHRRSQGMAGGQASVMPDVAEEFAGPHDEAPLLSWLSRPCGYDLE